MKLAVVSPFVDKSHGTERALAELIERLAQDYACEIYLYSQRVEDLRLGTRESISAANPGAIFWRKIPSVSGPYTLQFLIWIILNGLARRWDRLWHGMSFDLVLSPGINCFNADVVIVHAVFARLRELISESGAETHSGKFRMAHRRLYYGLLAWMERSVYSDKEITLVAVSRRTCEMLKSRFRRRDALVVPNGVDTFHFSSIARTALREEARKRRNLSGEDCVLLFIGNDWRIKGLQTVLEAMASLPAAGLRLLIAGNDVAAPFRQNADRLGIGNRCLWEQSRPDVIDYYAASDIYVSPSCEDSFGLPVAEAMACGLPVITSALAGVSECVQDGVDGFVIQNPRNAGMLSEILRKLSENPDLRRNIGQAAERKIAHWNWDRHAAAMWEILSATLAKRCGATRAFNHAPR
ncbi:MAG TPA: glycosyltransferase family 4 protein [Candidatus Acidoferrum sp.]|nr:glycosyltransferase family 4 protein [Candidatus Acidoferrum sp.]